MVTCHVCGGSDLDAQSYLRPDLAANPAAEEHFGWRQKMRCRKCGTGFVHPAFGDEDLGSYYAKAYWQGRSREPATLKLDFTRAKEHYVLLFSALADSASILDFGCGRGEFSLYVRPLFPEKQVIATDLSPTYKETLQSAGVQFLDSIAGCEDIDLLYASHSIEHVPDINASMETFLAMTSPNAHLFFEVPNIETPQVFAFCGHTPHTYMLCRRSFETLAARYNLDIVTIMTSGPSWLSYLRPPSEAGMNDPIYLRVLLRKRPL